MNDLSPDQRNKIQRRCFTEIIKGYSTLSWNNSFLFIKHLNHFDAQNTEEFYNVQFARAKKRGLPTEQERLKELFDQSLWGPPQENRIKDLEEFIEGLKENRKNLIASEQISQNKKETEEAQGNLNKLLIERDDLLRATCEHYAQKKQNDYYLLKSLYKDNNFNSLFYSPAEFEDEEQENISALFYLSNQKLDLFNDLNIKWLALAPFFQNLFSLSENVYQFYGKPIVSLSFYQTSLAIHASNFKHMISNSESIPDHIKDDPEAFEDFFHGNQNVKKIIQDKGEGVNIIGLSNKDQENYGLGQSQSGVININDMLKKGAITKEALIREIQ